MSWRRITRERRNPAQPVGTRVGARRWPFVSAHPSVWERPWAGEVLERDDPRAWTDTLAFTGRPTRAQTAAHVARLRAKGLELPEQPVLWDFGAHGRRVWWEKPHGLRTYEEDVAEWEAERERARAERERNPPRRASKRAREAWREQAAAPYVRQLEAYGAGTFEPADDDEADDWYERYWAWEAEPKKAVRAHLARPQERSPLSEYPGVERLYEARRRAQEVVDQRWSQVGLELPDRPVPAAEWGTAAAPVSAPSSGGRRARRRSGQQAWVASGMTRAERKAANRARWAAGERW